MKRKSILFLALLGFLQMTILSPAKSTKLAESCQGAQFNVAITTPARDDVRVGKEIDVKGTASIPDGNHLWVFSHRLKGFKTLWWPQGEGEPDPKTKQWEVHVVFGEPKDVGYEFEIAAITVDSSQHLKLQEYLEKSMTSGNWLPITMPPLTSAPQYRKVMKENHN